MGTTYERELRENGIHFPCVLCQIRTEKGKELRRKGIEVFRHKYLAPRADGIANTLTSVLKDNLIMIKNR